MRIGKEERKTKETDISVEWCLDGGGKCDIKTGLGFFDHMLELFAVHGRFDLTVKCKGDLKVDGHHSVEDVGIVLGKLLYKLLGDKKGITRYAAACIPMDESLARSVIDISGRPFLVFKGDFKGKIGDFDAQLIEEFFRAFATYGMITAHIEILYGLNAHHMAEAAFKSFARALKDAVAVTGSGSVLSSKGVLE
ncbi:MAG: imidazoleglycerol-phosphate dehydratase HisB [Firmicutes bacterium]|nr:imidazoleglycerol-phosphate dehydratase HisB [Bacillota bacterium]